MIKTPDGMVCGDRAQALRLFGRLLPDNGLVATMGDAGAVFVPVQPRVWEVHVAVLPRWRGRKAAEAFRTMLEWWWTLDMADKLVTATKKHNRAAGHMAVHLGFTRLGEYQVEWPDAVMRPTVLYEKLAP